MKLGRAEGFLIQTTNSTTKGESINAPIKTPLHSFTIWLNHLCSKHVPTTPNKLHVHSTTGNTFSPKQPIYKKHRRNIRRSSWRTINSPWQPWTWTIYLHSLNNIWHPSRSYNIHI